MFYSPTTIMISGATGSGKTSLLHRILKCKDEMFTVRPKKILYCYGAYQSLFGEMERDLGVEFHEGTICSFDL